MCIIILYNSYYFLNPTQNPPKKRCLDDATIANFTFWGLCSWVVGTVGFSVPTKVALVLSLGKPVPGNDWYPLGW